MNKDASRWTGKLQQKLPHIRSQLDIPPTNPVLLVGFVASFIAVIASARYENRVLPARMDGLKAELAAAKSELRWVDSSSSKKDEALKELRNANKDWSDRNDVLRKANRQLQDSITDSVLTFGRGQIYCRAENQFYTVKQVQQDEAVRNRVAVGKISGNCIGTLDQ